MLSLHELKDRLLKLGIDPHHRGPSWGSSGVGFGSFACIGETNSEGVMLTPNWGLAVEGNDVCSLRCKHCIYHRDAGESMDYEKLSESIEIACNSKWGVPSLASFAGKEPSLFAKQSREVFIRLASTLGRHGVYRIMMTNGRLVHEQPWVADYIECLDVSIDGDRKSHEMMRGLGTFPLTWENTKLASSFFKKVGIIATATQATLKGIPALQQLLGDHYFAQGNVTLSISFFYGPQGSSENLNFNPLSTAELIPFLETLQNGKFPVRLLWTPNMAHQTNPVLEALGVKADTLAFDARTGIPHVRSGQLHFILFNLTQAPHVALRVASDGKIYLGCNHLAFHGDTSRWAVGDLVRENLGQVLERCIAAQEEKKVWYGRLANAPHVCWDKDCFALCRGGDAITGYYLGRQDMQDPSCPIINGEVVNSGIAPSVL